MKNIIATIILLLIGIQISAQIDDKCLPKKLIVVAENLNFRSEPNTESESICKLENSELLTFIESQRTKENNHLNDNSNHWIKVKRDLTNEEGYVFGKYVKPQEMAYINYYDSDRLQTGNWYGIYQDGSKVRIEKAKPKIEESDQGFKSITSDDKHKIIICSQEEIIEGQINGKLFHNQREYLKIGIQKQLIRIKDFEFSIVCTGEVSFNEGWMKRENEKIIFAINEIDGLRRHYTQQDLSDCILQFGEVGYMIHFAGDLNNDGIPELIISEGTTHGGKVYYFKSNKDGKLELQSMTGIVSKC